ncbi:MAG: leucine-rich repeat domain-containing protein [Bacteroidaceae bacterium]|nr:leucine-rich repeat domain-containing protein [Bacteroidaceae bacterium]
MERIKQFFATIILLLLCSTMASAHHFEVDGIYYNIISSSDLTVEVTYRGSYSGTYDDEYSGAVVIPQTVTYNSKTYSVTSIGWSTFYNCTGLTSITVPNSVTSIGGSAFEDCTGLTSITIPNSVTSIGGSAFYNTAWYNNQPDGLVYAGKVLYEYKGRMPQNTSIIIKDGTLRIAKYAFSGCTGLTSVTIPNSVTTIEDYAFIGCSGLTSVTIPNSVTTIGDDAFESCDIAKTIWLTNTPPSGCSYAAGKINYVANNQYTQLGNVVVYPYLSSLFEVNGIKYVPVSPAERTCDAIDCIYDTAIETVNIGKTVLYKNIAMNVKEVMPYTCYKNKNIRNLTISNDGSIGDKAFYGCTGLSDITISNKGDIGNSAFEGSATSGSAKIKISNDGSIGDKAFYGCTGLSNVKINNKGDIGKSAFEGCTSVAAATLGDGITSIGESAFYGCSSLEEVVIPNSVTSLNSYAFCNCSALNSVVLSKKLSTIGKYAFSGCRVLPEIKIPQAVASIGDYAFKGCSSLADVIIEDRTAALSLGSNGSSPLFADSPLDSVYIGGKISYKTSSSYGYSPFYRNSSLRSVVITDVEEQIYDNEFYGCTGLKNVQIGNGVKSIGKWAFSGCSNLDYLIVGANVSSIGQEAFSDCSNVTTIYAHAMVPPVCEAQALEDINKWNCTLMVPNESIAEYQTAEQWKDFFFISDIPTGITEISPDDIEDLGNGTIYDLYGRPVNEPAKGGVYIIDGKKVVL